MIADLTVLPWRPLLAAFLVAQGLALALLAVMSLVRLDRARDGPAFRALCAAMGVSPSRRRMLVRAARRVGLGSDAACLVSQGCFEHVLRKAPLSEADRRSLHAFGRSIFGRLTRSASAPARVAGHRRRRTPGGYPVRRAPLR